MYINEIGVKEVNAYYALRDGRRTANIHSFANCLGNVSAGRTTTARSASIGNLTGNAAAAEGAAAGRRSDNSDSCCDKCEVTNQLLRMMSNYLYTQNALGYSSMGSGALAAYQSMSKYFGAGLFS